MPTVEDVTGRPPPVNPDSPKLAARRIRNESDMRDVIELMRLNYDRIVARHGLPTTAQKQNEEHKFES